MHGQMDGRMTDGRTDKDDQCETIIPRHCCVEGYKKVKRKVQGVPQSQTAALP